MGTHISTDVSDGLERDWPFRASEVPPWRRRLVFQAMLSRSRRRPPSVMLLEVPPRPVWAFYFSYALDGVLGDVQRFSLERLRDQGFAVLVVQAAAAPGLVDAGLLRYADALYWKGLAGYDFSAYTLGLEAIARHSPDADPLVLDDSVFGPFADQRPMLQSTPWELTGFTASGKSENHMQSCAFLLKNLTPQRLRRSRMVFIPAVALVDRDDVDFLSGDPPHARRLSLDERRRALVRPRQRSHAGSALRSAARRIPVRQALAADRALRVQGQAGDGRLRR